MLALTGGLGCKIYLVATRMQICMLKDALSVHAEKNRTAQRRDKP